MIFSWLHNIKQSSEILNRQIEMLVEVKNTMNIEAIGS